MLYQFAYNNFTHGKPSPAMTPVLDCRIPTNTYRRGYSDEWCKDRVRNDPLFESVVQQGVPLLKTHGVLWVGCSYGKHRSGAVASEISERTGDRVSIVAQITS